MHSIIYLILVYSAISFGSEIQFLSYPERRTDLSDELLLPIRLKLDLDQDTDGLINVNNEASNDDAILQSISDEYVNRYRRQATNDGIEGSGTGFFEESQQANESPEFEINLSISSADPVQSGTLSASDSELYRKEFETKLNQIYQNIPGFKEIRVKDVELDRNNRPTANFVIAVDGGAIGALGSTPSERIQNITVEIEKAGNTANQSEVLGSNMVPPSFNFSNFQKEVEILLDDICNSIDACNLGYTCQANLTVVGSYETGICLHSCYASNLNCQNGAICTLDENNKPYCQCGSNHEGTLCENSAVATKPLSTEEVVGITTGTLLMIAAVSSCFFFAIVCRKKDIGEVEYSYYGDEDNLMQGYTDQSSNLGVSNLYINRPRVSIQPLHL